MQVSDAFANYALIEKQKKKIYFIFLILIQFFTEGNGKIIMSYIANYATARN